jgi:hypothetical protein
MTGVLRARVDGDWVDIAAAGPPGPTGPPGADGADGTIIWPISGGPPSPTLGNDGDYALDTVNDILYGPRSTGPSSPEFIGLSDSGLTQANNTNEFGPRVAISVAGTITGVQYRRAAGNAATLTFNVWNVSPGTAGTLLGTTTDTRAGQAGLFTVNFPTPIAITAGQVIQMGITASPVAGPTPLMSGSSTVTPTAYQSLTGSQFYSHTGPGYPNTATSGSYNVPIFNPGGGTIATWPIALYGAADWVRLQQGQYEEALPRWLTRDNTLAAISQQLRLSFFTAQKTELIQSVRFATGSTASGASPTLVRVGVYSVAGSDGMGDLTLVASTPNDTTLLQTINTRYAKNLSAPWSKVAGQRYAIGILVVTSVTAPTFITMQTQSQASVFDVAPRLSAARSGQSDLPASINASNLVQVNGIIWFDMLP